MFFVFLKLVDFSDKIIDGTLSFSSALLLSFYLIPSFSIFTIPLICLSSILFTFSKLSATNEILALKTFGVSLLKLIKIPFIFGIFLFLLGIINNVYIIPVSTKLFLNKVTSVINGAGCSFKPGIFNSVIPSTVIFFKGYDKNKKMKHIFIYSKINKIPEIIVAETGTVAVKNNMFEVNLKKGNIFIKKPEESEIVSFQHYNLKYDLSDELGNFTINLKDKESSINEIRKNIELFRKKGNYQKVNYLLMEIYKRFSLPFASVLFVIIGTLFGIRNSRAPKSWTLTVLFIVIFIYYSAIMASNYFVKSGAIPPFAGSWLPNVIVALLTLFLLYLFKSEKIK